MKHERVCDYYFLLLFLSANTQDFHGRVIAKVQNTLSVMSRREFILTAGQKPPETHVLK